ncbi:hypothetical protein LCGC14_0895350 [marine sediment metagenome]|uniref:VWFA domain-containing protein n=1 Tax=marine sediment metagenome TaxID=412755 RepID=A0A0F9S4Z3_9ZZZZ|nr:MAG: hypothetical protein Lokiarch_47000 [Candidatus Lokiarchaeum sp. GC14_75]HEA70947.1 DUF58 domain-containing protein [archaeon]
MVIRWRSILGGKGRSLILFAVFFLTAGFAFENYFLLYFAILLLFSTIISLPLFHYKLNIEELRVHRELEKEKVFRDDFVHIKVVIENMGRNSFDFLEIRDNYNPQLFRQILGEHFISTRIGPKDVVKFSYVLEPKVRGEYALGPLSIIVKDRLGFNSVERIVPDSVTDILIYPPYEDIKRIEILGSKRSLQLNYGLQRSKQKGLGSEFYGMRKYVFGDQFRLIDWKASARHQKLIVKEFEDERDVTVMILVDSSETMAGGAIENTKFEYAVRACMLLTKVAITRRDNVGVFTFSDKKNFKFLKPGGGDDHFYQVLDFIARVKPEGKCKMAEAMYYFTRRFQKRSLIFIISDLEANPKEITEAMKKLIPFNHTVIVINPFSPWFEIHEIDLSSTDKALAEAISEEMMEHILTIRQGTRNMGINVISCGPDDMMNQVMGKYMEAKKKGSAY